MEKHIYQQIVEELSKIPTIHAVEKPGHCRLWSSQVLKIFRTQLCTVYPDVKIEAREVSINNSLSHTFIQLLARDDFPYFIDKIGIEDHPPYNGYAADAPAHLQNSHLDLLSY